MKKLILAVDDEQKILNSISSIFKNIEGDFNVRTCNSGKDAIKIISQQQPSLVITAIDIDYIDGLDIINSAKKLNIPTIVLSSRTDPETVEMIKSYYKPNFYLKKPLDQLEFINSIKSIFISRNDHIEGIPPDKREAVLKGICDSIDQGIAIIDPSFNIVWINKALEKKGFVFNQVIGKKSYHAFDNQDGPGRDNPTLKTFQNGEVNRITKKGQDSRNYRITSIPIRDDHGNVIYVIEFGEELPWIKSLS